MCHELPRIVMFLVPVQLLGTVFPGQGCSGVEPGTAMLGATQGCAMRPPWHMGQDMGGHRSAAPLITGGQAVKGR